MIKASADHGTKAAGEPRTQRPSRPAAFLIALAATGVGAGAWLVDSPGPGLFVLIVSLLGASAVALAGGTRLDHWSTGFAVLALALISTAVFRAASWLVVPSMFAALCLAALAVCGGSSWAQLVDSLIAPALRVPFVPGFVRRSLGPSARGLKAKTSLQVARGLAIGAVLVLVFGLLFSSADAVFRRIVSDLVPAWDLGLLPARGFVGLLFVVVTGAFAVARLKGRPRVVMAVLDQTRGAIKWRAGRIEWLTALGLLDALFAVFVTVQIAVLFGGRKYVLETEGLTYAEYARQGFAQLIVVAALTLAVVAVSWAWSARGSKREEILFRALLGILCVLTLVVLGSALRRLGLYEQAFGFTRLRIAAHGVILWLGTVLAAVLAAAALGKIEWLPRALVALSGAALLAFSLTNPDGQVARHNVERYRDIGKIDLEYLSSLSADAVPQLVRLPPIHKKAVLTPISRDLSEPEAWSSMNISRTKARSLIQANS